MQTPTLPGLALASLFTLTTSALAHGGQYLGPGDVVPPGGSGGGPRSGRPGTPTTPGPNSPSAPTPPGARTPGGGPPTAPPTGAPGAPGSRGGPRTPGGIALTPDLSRWQFWWEFNKHPYINLREALDAPRVTTGTDEFYLGPRRVISSSNTMKVSDSDIRERILPALKRALDSTDQRDVVSSCIVAMAKIGKDHEQFTVLPIVRSFLSRPDQEVRETAAIAMGIFAKSDAIDDLTALVADSPAARKLCDRPQVDDRTRSFACYGLGLIGHRNASVDVKRACFEPLAKILADDSARDRNIKVAAINAISLLNVKKGNLDDKERKLRDDALAALDRYYAKDAGRGTDLIKGHIPPAVAKIIGRGTSDVHQAYKEKYRRDLHSEKKRGADIYRAAAIALGQLCLPGEGNEEEKKYSDGLFKYYEHGKDPQAKYFCLISLGQIGGNKNRGRLLTELRTGRKSLDRPWAALALGILNYHTLKAGGDTRLDPYVASLMRAQLEDIKDPSALAAIAIGLGLGRQVETSGELLDLLHKHRGKEDLQGYICVSLALMNEPRAKDPIHELVRQSVRRPQLLQQAAIALGKLGDREVTGTLIGMLEKEDTNLAKLSAIASALAFIGDRRTITPLKTMLLDENLTPLSRAFAAVALGGIADKEMLPWNSKISRDMNYRAAVETLTQSGSGVLDIL